MHPVINALGVLDNPNGQLQPSAGDRAEMADHPRNKSDAELRLLADRGGVVGLYFMPYLRLAGQPRAADLIAHLRAATPMAASPRSWAAISRWHADPVAAMCRPSPTHAPSSSVPFPEGVRVGPMLFEIECIAAMPD